MKTSRKAYYQTEDQKQKAKIYREKNKEKILAYLKEYRENNKEVLNSKSRERNKKHYEKFKDKKLAKQQERRKNPEYRKKSNEYSRNYSKKRRQEDILYKITGNLRARFASIMKTNKSRSAKDLIGCDILFLKDYLESKFLPTMTWENYGEYWHIDHIKPCIKFDLSDKEEQVKCFHYTNLQPLFAVTQIINGVTYIGNTNKNSKYEF